jgi:hypothetical protein
MLKNITIVLALSLTLGGCVADNDLPLPASSRIDDVRDATLRAARVAASHPDDFREPVADLQALVGGVSTNTACSSNGGESSACCTTFGACHCCCVVRSSYGYCACSCGGPGPIIEP